MPRSSFSVNALQGATPGLSRLAGAIGGGDMAYESGYDQGVSRQSKIAQALANIRNQNASADAHTAMADQTNAETGVLRGRGDAIDESIAAGTGSTLPMVNAVRDFIRTGQRPMKAPVGPAMEDGTEATPFPVVDDGTQSAIAKALSRSLAMRTNLKDTSPDALAKATGEYRDQDLSDAIIRGTLDRNQVGGAQAAVAAKPLYHLDNTGATLDQYGGQVDTSNPLAQASIGLTGAKTKAEGALTAERFASADQHRASATKTRQEVADGIKTGQIQVITDNDGNVSLLNKVTGIARPATTAEGEQFVGKGPKPKDIPATVNTKIIEGKQGLRNIDAAIAAIEANPDALGFSNLVPGMQAVRQVTDPKGVGVRAQVANIGSLKLHDRSGAAVSASEFPRLAPFIPSAGDSPKAAVSKLREMKRIAEEELGLYADTYSADNGYRVPTSRAPAAPAAGFTYLGKE